MSRERQREGTLVKKTTLLVACLALLASTDARAQMQWTDLGFVNINGIYQVGDRSFTETLTSTVYNETATYDVRHDISGGAAFDVSGGVKVWRNLAAGFGLSIFNTSSTVALTGSVPHPVFVDRPRSVTHQEGGLDHRQLGYHFQATWVMPVTDKIDIAVFGGPSIFNVSQALVTDVEIVEVGAPFDTARVNRVVTSQSSKNGFGGNVGVDLTYLFTARVGAGLLLRWVGASVDLPASGGNQSVEAGGFHIGGGARIRF